MTAVFFVEERTIRQRVPGWDGPGFPVGFSADGQIVRNGDGNAAQVAVLLVDDLANPRDDFAVHLELSEPVTAVLHRPGIPWQSNWLEQIGAISFEGLSHQPGNPAYEQIKALLSATPEQRVSICQQVCDAYGTETLLSKLEELAAWLALPELSSDESSDADSVYDAVLALRPLLSNVSKETASIFERRNGTPKALAELTVADLENAAAVLVP